MSRIDLHVHSRYSEHSPDWFLQRIGAQESYTEPETIFQTARRKGMDFVTVTDHNSLDGSLALQKRYPDLVITGVECTTYFPEDGCKIHVLLFGLTQSQYDEIQAARDNIFTLREYIRRNGIAYSVAHASFDVNKKLTVDHLEQLILMFDVFEGINGGRVQLFNDHWMEMMKRLTPRHIDMLYERHRIEPISREPWAKVFTAGSDDHAGLFIGDTYTVTEARTASEVVENIRAKRVDARGRHNDYRSLVFSIYKVAYDFAKTKKDTSANPLFMTASKLLFEPPTLSIQERLKMQGMAILNHPKRNRISDAVAAAVKDLQRLRSSEVTDKLDTVFNRLSDIADEYFRSILDSLNQDIMTGKMVDFIINVSAALPGIFLALPFFSGLKHLYHNRPLLDELERRLGFSFLSSRQSILWFTDTINDLNGVSETLKDLGRNFSKFDLNCKIVCSKIEQNTGVTLPPGTILMPTFYTLPIPNYESYVLKFPSMLKSVEILCREEPTEIVVSTPGPIGLLGILTAKLMHVKSIGIYHTDYTLQIEKILNDHSLNDIVESYTRWFYAQCGTVKVQTMEYKDLLEKRGFDRKKFDILKKSIDSVMFSWRDSARSRILGDLNLDDCFTLLYAGRLSRDKNIDFMIDVYRVLTLEQPDVNLIVAGDGPYGNETRALLDSHESVRCVGTVPRSCLPDYYSACDLLLFPSTTDTFGMVVLEAQACELVAIVTDQGGPKEIIRNRRTGYVLSYGAVDDWVRIIRSIMRLKDRNPEKFLRMKRLSRRLAIRRFNTFRTFQTLVRHPHSVSPAPVNSMPYA